MILKTAFIQYQNVTKVKFTCDVFYIFVASENKYYILDFCPPPKRLEKYNKFEIFNK